MTFGERIRWRREGLGLTQKALQKASKISQQMLSSLERGKASGTTELAALARALQVSAHWLKTGEGPMEPPPLEYISSDEREMLEEYRAMTHEEKAAYRLLLGSHRKNRATQIASPEPPQEPQRRIA